MLRVPSTELIKLEQRVVDALAAADESGLEILGFGEVTLVLRLRAAEGDYACKRLPSLTPSQLDAHWRLVLEYIDRLSAAGVHVAPTNMWSSTTPSGAVIPYLLQETLPADRLANVWLRRASDDDADRFFARVLEHTMKTVRADVGLDVQASNWIVMDDRLHYLDITTPLMRDAQGRERLDVRPFFRSLPWGMRDIVRIATGKQMFDKFYSPRGAILDLLGNLVKERLEKLVPRYLKAANAVLDQPISPDEVERYYAGDAKMWGMIQKLRRADRWWQRSVRRRPYPFLLPRNIAR